MWLRSTFRSLIYSSANSRESIFQSTNLHVLANFPVFTSIPTQLFAIVRLWKTAKYKRIGTLESQWGKICWSVFCVIVGFRCPDKLLNYSWIAVRDFCERDKKSLALPLTFKYLSPVRPLLRFDQPSVSVPDAMELLDLGNATDSNDEIGKNSNNLNCMPHSNGNNLNENWSNLNQLFDNIHIFVMICLVLCDSMLQWST